MAGHMPHTSAKGKIVLLIIRFSPEGNIEGFNSTGTPKSLLFLLVIIIIKLTVLTSVLITARHY